MKQKNYQERGKTHTSLMPQKWLLCLLTLLVTFVGSGRMAADKYVFDNSSSVTHVDNQSTYNFNGKNILVNVTEGTTYKSGTATENGFSGIKFGVGRTFTMTFPENEIVKKVTFVGKSRKESTTSYVSHINGASRSDSNTETHKFPVKTSETTGTYEVPFDITLKNEFSFKIAGAEVVLQITVVTETKPTQFSQTSFTTDMSTASPAYPTLQYIPAGSTVTYLSSEKSVAEVGANDDSSTYWVRLKNSGTTTIQASINGEVVASYTLTVTKNNSGSFTTSGNTCVVNTAGTLSSRTVSLTDITMTIGGENDTPMIRDVNGALGAMVVDANGFEFAIADSYSVIPDMGTVFKFEPSKDGTLTVSGYSYQKAKMIVVSDNSRLQVGELINSNSMSTPATQTYSLTKGTTYYLLSNEQYGAFYLKEFSFVPSNNRFQYEWKFNVADYWTTPAEKFPTTSKGTDLTLKTTDGIDLPETHDLTFTNTTRNAIYTYNRNSNIRLNAATTVTLPKLTAGQKVTIIISTHGGGTTSDITFTNLNETSLSLSGSSQVERTYIVQADGTVTLHTSNIAYIYSIKVANPIPFDFAAPAMTIPLTAHENSIMSTIFGGNIPTNQAELTWTSSNEAVAKYDSRDNNKKLRLVDVGQTTITITDGNGVSTSLKLTVTAGQATHIITDMGNMTTKCEVSGVGKLNDERTVLRVPNILFRHGIWGFEDNPADPSDKKTTYYKQVHSSTIVREYELTEAAGGVTKVYGASTIDQDGVANTGMDTNRPNSGTFYTFDPEVSGTLVVHGYIVNGEYNVFPIMYQWSDNADGTISYKGAFANTSSVPGTDFINKGVVGDDEIKLTEITMTYELAKGHTYFMNGGITDAGNPRIYLLDYFTFTPKRPNFATKSVRWDKVNTSGKYTQTATVGGGAAIEYNAYVIDNSQVNPSVDRTVRSANSNLVANISSTGEVSISGQDGGAILVTATVNKGNAAEESDYYIITVPYDYTLNNNAGHIWNFANTVDWKKHMVDDDMSRNEWETALKSLKKRSDWKTEHKVKEYKGVNGALSYINVPVVASTAAVDGNNAFYIPNTAGLTFSTADRTARFGSLVKGWRQDTNDKDFTYYNKYGDDLKAKLEIPFTEVEFTDWVAICDGASFTIPNVPQDWFVKIYWSEHSAHNGSCFQATNVKDLEGREIDPAHCFVITGHDVINSNGMPDGVVVFKAKETGDVTFTLNDPDKEYSWNDIIRIEVCKNYSTDLTLRLDQTGTNLHGDKVTCDNENSGHVVVKRKFIEAGTSDVPMTNYDHIKGFYYKGLVDYDEYIKATPSNPNQPKTYTEGVTKIYSGVVGPCRCERGLSPLFTFEDVDGANVVGGKIEYYYGNTGAVYGKFNDGEPVTAEYTTMRNGEGIVVDGQNMSVACKIWRSAPGGNEEKGCDYFMFWVTYKGGYGNVKVTQKISRPIRNAGGVDDWSTQYTLDLKETYIAVGELNVMPYPYTWDFRNVHYQDNVGSGSGSRTSDALWSNRTATENADVNISYSYNSNIQYGVYGAWSYTYGTGNQLKLYAPDAEKWYKEGSELKNFDSTPYLYLENPQPKSRFALNSQVAYANGNGTKLTEGGAITKNTPIKETQGLGIGVSKISGLTPDVVNIGDETGGLLLQSNNGGQMKLTIPDVPAGMYVFVKASTAPTVTGATRISDGVVASEDYTWNGKTVNYKFNSNEVASGVYVYKVETAGDVVLSSADIKVEAIGVTDEFKKFTNTAGWVTESRPRRTDYDNTALFTTHDLDAYIATSTATSETFKAKYEGMVMLTPKRVVPPTISGYSEYTGSNKGLMLHDNRGSRADGLVPLFVPACNYVDDFDSSNPLTTNYLVHHFDDSSNIPGTAEDYGTIRYVFTNTAYKWTPEDIEKATGGTTDNSQNVAKGYNFYIIRQDGLLRANTAYLELSKAEADKTSTAGSRLRTLYIMYPGTEDEEVVAIDGVFDDDAADIIDNKPRTVGIYTLNGAKLNTLPTKKGIYIIDGKKVYVK